MSDVAYQLQTQAQEHTLAHGADGVVGAEPLAKVGVVGAEPLAEPLEDIVKKIINIYKNFIPKP
jgi:hypothetical protein